MTDLSTAFAELRSDERSRVTPPGVEAARHTVRRRRRLTRATAGIAALVLFSAGGGYLAGTGQPSGADPAAGGVTEAEIMEIPPGFVAIVDSPDSAGVRHVYLEKGLSWVGVVPNLPIIPNENFVPIRGLEPGTHRLLLRCVSLERSTAFTFTARVGDEETIVTVMCQMLATYSMDASAEYESYEEAYEHFRALFADPEGAAEASIQVLDSDAEMRITVSQNEPALATTNASVDLLVIPE